MTDRAQLHALATTLRARRAAIAALDLVAGFDGFVDEMTSVVEERTALDAFRPVASLKDMGGYLAAAAGRSALREIVVHRRDAGGCAVNLGDGLTALGVRLDYFGTLGTPRVAAFDAFAATCRSCTSWGREPGRTMALEFADGKYMLCSVSQLAEFTPALLDRVLADGAFLAACRRARAIAITNWTLYPHMTACWRHLQQQVFARLTHRPVFFIDLVDPSGRSGEDIHAMLDALRGFTAHGETVLGLNGNEGNVLARLLGLAPCAEDPAALAAQATALRARLGLDAVVIHGVRSAALAEAGGSADAPTPFCAQPKKLTGAGDRFNAGYLLGRCLDLAPRERLLLGNATSGFFVRQARSATLDELASLLDAWGAGALAG
jgi:sugar/nucleoside kinase (ribokinase family)